MQKQLKRSALLFPFIFVLIVIFAAGAYAGTPMYDFDYARYGSDYPDVLRAYGPEIYRSDLYLHYLKSGAAEGRVAYSISTGEPFVLDANEAQAYEQQKTLKSSDARLNNAVLSPNNNWPEALQTAAGNIINNVSGSTPTEKLRSCYDWLINNCSYGQTSGSLKSGGFIAEEAYAILETHVGVCDNYSAAFTVMARMLGFDARLQSGYTTRASGGYTGHTWCVINIHGVDYVFDPQVEDNIAKGGKISYLRYCKTYDEVAGKYILYSDDTVRDDIMSSASNAALPRYSFGLGGQYWLAVNEARAQAGLAALQWDEELAGQAFRVANGGDFSAEVKGRGSYSYGWYPSTSDAMGTSYQYIGAYMLGPAACVVTK